MTTFASTASKLLAATPNKMHQFIVLSAIIAIFALFVGVFSGFCITRKHLFESFLYKRHKKFLTKLMLNDINNIKKFIEKDLDQQQLTVDLNKVSYQLCKVLNDDSKHKIKKEKLSESNADSKNILPLSIATFGVSSMSSIDKYDSPTSAKHGTKTSPANNDNILGGKHSRYINKNTDCYTIQNTYSNMKDIEKEKIACNPYNSRTSSTSSNNSSSSTSGILTSFTNSDTCLFKHENLSSFKVTNEYLNNYYVTPCDSVTHTANNNNNNNNNVPKYMYF